VKQITGEELLAFVGLPLAVIATTAGIAALSQRKTRIVLLTCLGLWVALTSVLLVVYYNNNEALAPRKTSPYPPDRQEGESLTDERVTAPPYSGEVRDSARREQHPITRNALRAQLLGSWTGSVPNTGSLPVKMTVFFSSHGTLSEQYESENSHWRREIAAYNTWGSGYHYDISMPDTIKIRYVFLLGGGPPPQSTIIQFMGRDTLIWNRLVLGRGPVTVNLIRVRAQSEAPTPDLRR
jgi:hypothetical protein